MQTCKRPVTPYSRSRSSTRLARVSQAAHEHEAAISSLKGEQTIERVKSEAEVETTTVCAMYEEQLATCLAGRI